MIKYIILIIVCALVITSGLKLASRSNGKVSDSNYELECYYMAYACGECTAQYRVKRVLDSSKSAYTDLVGSDIKVVFNDTALKKRISALTSTCAICYHYYFTGVVKKEEKEEHYTMEVERCTVHLKDSTCCDVND